MQTIHCPVQSMVPGYTELFLSGNASVFIYLIGCIFKWHDFLFTTSPTLSNLEVSPICRKVHNSVCSGFDMNTSYREGVIRNKAFFVLAENSFV